MRFRFLGALLLAAACGGALDLSSNTPADAQRAGVATEWMRFHLDTVRNERIGPPAAARVYAYAAVALFEGVAAAGPPLNSLGGQLNGLPALPAAPAEPIDAVSVANRAVAEVARSTIAESIPPASTTGAVTLASITGMEQQWEARRRAAVPMDVVDRSIAHGDAIAAALLAWIDADGYTLHHNAPYTPPLGPGLWSPTPTAFARALEPEWGQLRTLVLNAPDECDVLPPTPYSTDPASAFHAEAMEVYDAVLDATPEQKAIARFWSDDPGVTSTPAGHWISIAVQLVTREDFTLERAVELYARTGIAVNDAFIACWWTKFRDNYVRPVTYIQQQIDGAWLPLLGTPPFPEYTSGHSVQSGAASTVMTDMLGDRRFIDTTHEARGLPPRFFESFRDAAEEAAISRLYGGIHFRPAIENGVEQGRCIGGLVAMRVDFSD